MADMAPMCVAPAPAPAWCWRQQAHWLLSSESDACPLFFHYCPRACNVVGMPKLPPRRVTEERIRKPAFGQECRAFHYLHLLHRCPKKRSYRCRYSLRDFKAERSWQPFVVEGQDEDTVWDREPPSSNTLIVQLQKLPTLLHYSSALLAARSRNMRDQAKPDFPTKAIHWRDLL